ncbi:MAG: HIT family protein [bacterium]
MNRNIDTENRYRKYRKTNNSDLCVFCNPPNAQVIKELKYFRVLANEFPYDKWDYRQVEKHLMLVSKKHYVSLSEFSKKEKDEYTDTIIEYEKKGYNIYTRTNSNGSKSVGHVHTHLIKTNSNEFIALTYQKEPYISKATYAS